MSAPVIPALTSAEKSGMTKRRAYDAKVRSALQDLVLDSKRSSIHISDICVLAGVSSDPIYAPHHEDLYQYVKDEIAHWESSKVRKRKRRVPQTEAETKLQNLKDENTELKRKLANTQLALNVLGQMLESALSDRPFPSIVPIQRPSGRKST